MPIHFGDLIVYAIVSRHSYSIKAYLHHHDPWSRSRKKGEEQAQDEKMRLLHCIYETSHVKYRSFPHVFCGSVCV